ncbi:hypothetical protein A4R26_01140 [Niastella populi]|uniref:Uncharacterized protein n=1 Tax=Niastella populi TaxID=550983 RepID=A0A1V9GD09_9BACT|nr:hypothetical protein A4R26_01140 [Niastella populi]
MKPGVSVASQMNRDTVNFSASAHGFSGKREHFCHWFGPGRILRFEPVNPEGSMSHPVITAVALFFTAQPVKRGSKTAESPKQ